MTLVVETGTGNPAANTYADASYVVAYGAGQGVTIDPTHVETMILQAMVYIESFFSRFRGNRKTLMQGLSWPRTGAIVYGFAFPDDAIPNQLRMALAQAVVEISNGFDLMPSQDNWAVRVEKVDVIQIQYASGGGGQGSNANAPMKPEFPKVDALLNPLLKGDGMLQLWAVRA